MQVKSRLAKMFAVLTSCSLALGAAEQQLLAAGKALLIYMSVL